MRFKDYAKKNNLDLDIDIRTFFPQLKDYPHAVSFEQLLTHTAGFTDFFSMQEILANPGHAWTNDEIFDLILKYPPKFVPGTAQFYSNVSYFFAWSLFKAKRAGVELFCS